MTSIELHQFLRSQELRPDRNAEAVDAVYRCPTRRWVLDVLAPSFAAKTAQLGLSQYVSERNDCDDFARRFREHASICHALTPTAGQTGLAVGTLFYRPQSGEQGHAVVLAVIYDSGAPELLFVEPQTGRQISLTVDERKTCFGYSF